MYVFGGLSGTSTSYNDLWVFDLAQKIWSRPLSNGSFPSPKAAATFIPHEKKILLYGGYSHPYSYVHQQTSFFDELHIFCTVTSQWNQVLFSQEAPKLAGHTASIINGNKLIMFGGCNGSLGNKTNAVYSLDLDNYEWDTFSVDGSQETRITREIDGFKPEARYGHSQISLDDERVLIIGGCGGPNKQYDDFWILNWPKDKRKHAFWQQIIVNNAINSPAQIYCISFVRYDNKLVTFGKPRIPPPFSLTSKTENKPHISNPFVSDGFQNPDNSDMNVYTIAGNDKTLKFRKCSCMSLSVPIINSTSHLLPNPNVTPENGLK